MAEHAHVTSSDNSNDVGTTGTTDRPFRETTWSSDNIPRSGRHVTREGTTSSLGGAVAGRLSPTDSKQEGTTKLCPVEELRSMELEPGACDAASIGNMHAADVSTVLEEAVLRVSTSTGPPRDSTLLQASHEIAAPTITGTAHALATPAPGDRGQTKSLEDEHQHRSSEISMELKHPGDCRMVTEAAGIPEAAESPLQGSLWQGPAAAGQTDDDNERNGCTTEYQQSGEKEGGLEAAGDAVENEEERGKDDTGEGMRENSGRENQRRQTRRKRQEDDSLEGSVGNGDTDDAKEEATAAAANSTAQPYLSEYRAQSLSEEILSASSTLAGTGAEVLAESPPNEVSMCNSVEPLPRRDGTQSGDGKGGPQETLATPPLTLPPADSDVQLPSSSSAVISTSLPTKTVPLAAAKAVAGFQTTGMAAQAEMGFERRPSYMPEQVMRPARSKARASIQLTLQPLLADGNSVSSDGGPNIDQTKSPRDPAAVKPGDSGQPEEEESWQAYHAINPGRQHSTANLVNIRRNRGPYRSVELIDASDSSHADAGGSSSSSSSSDTERDADKQEEEKDSVEDPVSWQQSEEGKSRMAQLKKATVAAESPATKISRKYLKLFAPSNSAHATYKALAALHRRMNGTGWPRRGGWGSYLVRRSQAELDEGRVYGIKSKAGAVELLVLSSNNVCGRIPPIIAKLESLKCINLSDNHISGPIPVELGLLLQLQTLQLQGNNLRDNISPLLGSLISLIRLSLGHNKLSGSLPDSLGNLIHLQYFSAEHNRLSGSIPSFMCHMTALEVFHVSHNDLSGPIPDKIGSLARLKKLDLSSNRLSGELPPGLGSLSALNWLRLDNNVLTGTVPASLGNLTELLILNLSSNRLSGALPAALGTLINLTTASLRGNSFHGPFQLPSSFQFWFSRTSGMRTLDLGSNELEEPFPDLKGIRQLRSLVLDNNRIYGGLEEQGLAEACPNLHKLHLQNNRLTGEIPHSLGLLAKLEELNLSNNCFEGSLPSSMAALTTLNTFSASNNELSGDLPPFLGELSLLTCLALDGNCFGGTIPREIGKLTMLKRLYLERNGLVGSIPSELAGCLALEELYLNDNKMWGKIPDPLRALRELRYLYLYRNKITGTVPEWLGELSHLRGLILGENRLRGSIPWQLGHLHKLEDLYLNDNNLNGHIPERMVVNCECLQRLYLGGNRLTGTVPRYLRHVRNLRELNIERNNLHGELPIPLFLKASLGPDACGLKWDGNPRIVDSRHNFAITLASIRRSRPESVEGATSTLSCELEGHTRQQQEPMQPDQQSVNASSFGPIPLTLRALNGPSPSPPRTPSTRHSSVEMPASVYLEQPKEGSTEFDPEEGFGMRGEGGEGYSNDDRGGVGIGRPWANSEDVSYFLLKVIVGNTLILVDFFIAARLHVIGCLWGCVLVMFWKVLAGFEGVRAARCLGYGRWWLPMAAFGLALTWQARICFHHSCESDLFQALQQVEWRWHALLQLSTQLAAGLWWWGEGQVGYWYLFASVGMKALVVGVVSMQRLDDTRLTRDRDRRTSSPPRLGATPSVFRHRFLPWLRDSAWPRLILVGFHVAEACERTIPIASLTATLGDWAFLAPLALLPGMLARYVVRRPGVSRAGFDGVAAAVKTVLKMSLALDSAFGAGTPGHLVAAISTTAEAIVFESVASNAPRDYPDALHQLLIYLISTMFVFTWVVVFLEMAIPVGRERLPPPPSPRLKLLGGRFVSSRAGSASRSRQTTTTKVHVQPSSSSLVGLQRDHGDSSESCKIESDDRRKSGWRGGTKTASVVPGEG